MRSAIPGGFGGVLLTDEERADLRRFVERHGFLVSCKRLGLLDGERVQPRTRDRIMASVRS